MSARSIVISAQLCTALETGLLLPLLDDDLLPATLSLQLAPQTPKRTGNRAEAISWFSHLHLKGFRALAKETVIHPSAVVLGIRESRREPGPTGPALFSVFHLGGGQITHIHTHTTMGAALLEAYAGPGTSTRAVDQIGQEP